MACRSSYLPELLEEPRVSLTCKAKQGVDRCRVQIRRLESCGVSQCTRAQRLVNQLPELLRMESSRDLPNQRIHDIVGERMPVVVVAGQQRRRGRFANPCFEAGLPVTCEQSVSDDVPSQ